MRKYLLLITIFFISISNLFSQKVVEMNYENGIYTIPCKVNGIPMKFIFDTGASDVSISLTEAKFLIKQGLLGDDDIKGTVKYKIANGEIEEGTKIILKEINIGGYILENIEASIVHQLNAPLLLGQSAISKLGTFQLDGNKLIIQSNNYNELEFLGIDLTKDIEDFGLSRVNLEDANPLLPIDFNYLKISKDHFLKDFQFDKQRIVFDSNGNIAIIILQKLILGNNYEKENKSKNVYKSLIQNIDKNYWVTKTKKARNATWKSKNLELLITIDNDKSINVIYIPKILKNLNSNLINKKNNNLKPIDVDDKKKNDKLQELRLEMAKLIEKFVTNTKFDVVVTSKNENLNINIYKKFYDPNPGNSTLVAFIDNLSFNIFNKAISKQDILNTITEVYNDVIFDYHFTFSRGKNFNEVLKISKYSLPKLSYPINEQRFKRLLEK